MTIRSAGCDGHLVLLDRRTAATIRRYVRDATSIVCWRVVPLEDPVIRSPSSSPPRAATCTCKLAAMVSSTARVQRTPAPGQPRGATPRDMSPSGP
jgi:hypothetical protein